MIDIKVLASSSAGNCYLLNDGTSQIMLEAGIPLRQMQKACGFTVTKSVGCLITYEHQDHSKAVNDLINLGIDCYMSEGTANAIQISNYKKIKAGQQFNAGSWKIIAFNTQHDAAEPLGYLLLSQTTNEKLVFITDSYYVKYTFPDLDYMLVECNYANDILDKNVEDGVIHPNMAKRVRRSHMSLDSCKDLLIANDLSKVKEIWLCHLSDNNSDAERFKKEIAAVSGRPVYIAG